MSPPSSVLATADSREISQDLFSLSTLCRLFSHQGGTFSHQGRPLTSVGSTVCSRLPKILSLICTASLFEGDKNNDKGESRVRKMSLADPVLAVFPRILCLFLAGADLRMYLQALGQQKPQNSKIPECL